MEYPVYVTFFSVLGRAERRCQIVWSLLTCSFAGAPYKGSPFQEPH
ncbi:hypothetical protein X975_19049, partial [Stegodyphus mimosarum]